MCVLTYEMIKEEGIGCFEAQLKTKETCNSCTNEFITPQVPPSDTIKIT